MSYTNYSDAAQSYLLERLQSGRALLDHLGRAANKPLGLDPLLKLYAEHTPVVFPGPAVAPFKHDYVGLGLTLPRYGGEGRPNTLIALWTGIIVGPHIRRAVHPQPAQPALRDLLQMIARAVFTEDLEATPILRAWWTQHQPAHYAAHINWFERTLHLLREQRIHQIEQEFLK